MENNEGRIIAVAPADPVAAPAPVQLGAEGSGVFTALAALPVDSLIDQRALADAFRVCERTLRRMVRAGQLPPPVALGARRVWIAGRVRDWLAGRAAEAERRAKRQLAKIEQFSA